MFDPYDHYAACWNPLQLKLNYGTTGPDHTILFWGSLCMPFSLRCVSSAPGSRPVVCYLVRCEVNSDSVSERGQSVSRKETDSYKEKIELAQKPASANPKVPVHFQTRSNAGVMDYDEAYFVHILLLK